MNNKTRNYFKEKTKWKIKVNVNSSIITQRQSSCHSCIMSSLSFYCEHFQGNCSHESSSLLNRPHEFQLNMSRHFIAKITGSKPEFNSNRFFSRISRPLNYIPFYCFVVNFKYRSATSVAIFCLTETCSFIFPFSPLIFSHFLSFQVTILRFSDVIALLVVN